MSLVCVMGGLAICARAETEPAATARDTPAPSATVVDLGQVRAGLATADQERFDRGLRLFKEKLPGFGPLFNDTACADCHFIPAVGGSGDLVHVAHMAPGPGGEEMELFRRQALPGWTVPERPAGASHRVAPSLYGLGVIERIPDQTIRNACGPGHVDTAKLQGALPRNVVARFGAKPFMGTVVDFVGAALLSESSVTNAVEGGTDDDALADPEVGPEFVESLAVFVRALPPPPRAGSDAAGEAAFHSFGCAGCHIPDMPPAIGVFSNFCLHHMGGALADGISDHEAKGDEFRTTPLWGLRFRKIYLHDGRASTLDEAVTAHGGDAAGAAAAYAAAPAEQRAALVRFLNTL